MTTQIMPEPFSAGDFTACLRQLERCAVANEWDTATRLLKLPAFLHGPAADDFESLAKGERDKKGPKFVRAKVHHKITQCQWVIKGLFMTV